jgi:hypothetical protein
MAGATIARVSSDKNLSKNRRYPMVSKKSKQQTGITHFPLQDEKISQRQVPHEGRRKRELRQQGAGKRGHRLSRKSGRAGAVSSNNEFEGSGGKAEKPAAPCGLIG